MSFDTYRFDDYSKAAGTMFCPRSKAKIRPKVFQEYCRKAFEMGARFAGYVTR